MISFDDLAPHYRRARDRWPDAENLAAAYDHVLSGFEGDGHGVLEAAKSFLECICRTMLGEFGRAQPEDPSTTELLVEALHCLGIEHTQEPTKFNAILSAHNRLADALSDARNSGGRVAHGRDGFLDRLGGHYVRVYLLTVDAILALLLGALEGTDPDLTRTREPYERFKHLHNVIDAQANVAAELDVENGVLVLDVKTRTLSDGITLRVPPSRLLYQLDRPAYVEVLDSLPKRADASAQAEAEITQLPGGFAGSTGVAIRLVRAYRTGSNREHLPGLERLLKDRNLPAASGRTRLAESLLATFDANAGLDWSGSEVIRARVGVAIKRVLRAHGVKEQQVDGHANEVLRWLERKLGSKPQ